MWPFNKHEDKEKATATMVVVVVAVEVVVVAKVEAKENGIGEGKSKRTTLKRPSFSPPRFALIAGQSTTSETKRGKRALTLVKKTKDKRRKVKAKEERTTRKEARKKKKKAVEETRAGERRTKEKEAKKKVTTKGSLWKRNPWKSCRKMSGKRSVREFSGSQGKRNLLAAETQGKA